MLGTGDLTVIDGAASGAWIEPGLAGEIGSVGALVPRVFEAYARVFHPAVGEMDEEALASLCAVLAARTADPDHRCFGICTIMGWVEDACSPEERRLPRLRLPLGRDHVVLAGPLSAVDQIADHSTGGGGSMIAVFAGDSSTEEVERARAEAEEWVASVGWRHSPQLIWPTDRSWLVVTEVDFDSTLVGGGAELIAAVVDSPGLEAWAVDPDVSLACGADELDPVEGLDSAEWRGEA